MLLASRPVRCSCCSKKLRDLDSGAGTRPALFTTSLTICLQCFFYHGTLVRAGLTFMPLLYLLSYSAINIKHQVALWMDQLSRERQNHLVVQSCDCIT